MTKAYLFYGNQLVDVFEREVGKSLSRQIKDLHGQEIYDGGWIYASWGANSSPEWWRCDMTPWLLHHVPKELRALVLLIT
jgi:hypothetical protein